MAQDPLLNQKDPRERGPRFTIHISEEGELEQASYVRSVKDSGTVFCT